MRRREAEGDEEVEGEDLAHGLLDDKQAVAGLVLQIDEFNVVRGPLGSDAAKPLLGTRLDEIATIVRRTGK